MRYFLNFIIFFLFPFFSFAQSPSFGSVIEEEFKTTLIPEKWRNESAVIIGMKEEYLFKRKVLKGKITAGVEVLEFIHKRIKLQDKNAVEQFSTFYYNTLGQDGSATYQVIKVDGKTVDINMSAAIEEEQEVPDMYKPIYYKMKFKSMKIAIPDLEVGDIVDYTVKSTLEWDMKDLGINFTPFIFSLSNNYPTLYQQYRFTMANGMKVKYRSFNGAPNIKYDAKASVLGEKESYLSYYFLDKDREKTGDERWSYVLRSTPSVKFRVVFLDYEPGDKTLSEATVDRSGLDVAQVYRGFAGAAFSGSPVVTSMTAYVTQYILKKKEAGVLKTEEEVIKESYYCLRKVFLEMYYKGPVHSDLEKYMTGKKLYKKKLAAEAKNTDKEEKEDQITMRGPTFATALRNILIAQGIQSELFVYIPRKLGTWKDAIFFEELDYLMKVKIKGKAYYLDALDNFSAFATPYSYLENAEGYSIRFDEIESYYKTQVGITPASVSLAREEFHVKFSPAMDIVQAERINTYTGAEKSPYIAQANLDRKYLDLDFEKYYAEPMATGKGKKKEEVTTVSTTAKYEYAEQAEQEKERTEQFKKNLDADFDIDKYSSFVLDKNGRYGDTAALVFTENFQLKKLLSKAGKNYVFELGKFMGGQIKLEPKEIKTRLTDIYIPNARVIEIKVIVDIPAGYSVEGLTDMMSNIDNLSGSFTSNAVVENDKLIFTTRKIYKNSFDKKEAWPNYVAFLEQAYKISQGKVVFKKK